MKVMDESESQMVAFEIILHSGNARTSIHEAMDFMKEEKFEEAEAKLAEADEELTLAHKSQADMLHEFGQGTKIEIQIIMVHAQDHLMTTMTLKEVAEEMKCIYKRL